MSNTPTVQIRVSQTMNSAPKTDRFLEYLQWAVQGGEPTFDFFSGDFAALQELSATIAKNPQAWVKIEPGSGQQYGFLDNSQPAYHIQGQKGNMVVQFHPSAEVFGQDTTDYKQAGIATSYLVTDKGVVDVIVSYIEKSGPPVIGVALAPAIITVLVAFKNFLQAFISRAFSAAAEGATETAAMGQEAAAGAAEDAIVEGEVLTEELTMSVSFGPLAIVGIVVAAITLLVSVILFFLAKTMTCFVRVYNFTDQQLTLNIGLQYDLTILQAPQSGVMPPVGVPSAPPGVKALDKVIYRADYVFLNYNDLKGLGVVINIPCAGYHDTDPSAFPGLTFMFDVPAVGDNSIFVNLDYMDPDVTWTLLAGKYTQLRMVADSGVYRAYMATNQLKGESPSPITRELGYYYEFLVVVEKDQLFSSKI